MYFLADGDVDLKREGKLKPQWACELDLRATHFILEPSNGIDVLFWIIYCSALFFFICFAISKNTLSKYEYFNQHAVHHIKFPLIGTTTQVHEYT